MLTDWQHFTPKAACHVGDRNSVVTRSARITLIGEINHLRGVWQAYKMQFLQSVIASILRSVFLQCPTEEMHFNGPTKHLVNGWFHRVGLCEQNDKIVVNLK